MSRVYSEENDFKNGRSQMKSWFLKRGYPKKLIENEMRKVNICKEGGGRLKELKACREKRLKELKAFPIVVTYRPN